MLGFYFFLTLRINYYIMGHSKSKPKFGAAIRHVVYSLDLAACMFYCVLYTQRLAVHFNFYGIEYFGLRHFMLDARLMT